MVTLFCLVALLSNSRFAIPRNCKAAFFVAISIVEETWLTRQDVKFDSRPEFKLNILIMDL